MYKHFKMLSLHKFLAALNLALNQSFHCCQLSKMPGFSATSCPSFHRPQPWWEQCSLQLNYQNWRVSGTLHPTIQHRERKTPSNIHHLDPQSNLSTSSPQGSRVGSLLFRGGEIVHQRGIQNSRSIDYWWYSLQLGWVPQRRPRRTWISHMLQLR